MAVALVVGGARGIGRAVVRQFRARGDSVAVADIDMDAALATAGEDLCGSAIAIECDIGTEGGGPEAVMATIDEFQHLDSVCANAGILIAAPLDDWTADLWDVTMRVNLRGPFLLVHAAARYLAQSANPSVVLTSSAAAFRASDTSPAYNASKAGLVNLTRSLTKALAPPRSTSECGMPRHNRYPVQ